MAKNPLIKPYLKWAGGKRQLLPEIKRQMPACIRADTYYEPFVGAGALLFDVQPPKAVINDLNTQLILTYRVIREQVDELIEILKKHQENNSKEYFYRIRSLDRDEEAFQRLSDVEKAARLIFLNKTCYNGLYRVNSQGLFNVPYGRYRRPAICEEPVLRADSTYLTQAEITIRNGDFADAVRDADAHSFVYFDPPYHSPNRTNFTGYQAEGFGEREQTRLRDVFAALTDCGAKCLLSNSDTPWIRGLYADPRFVLLPVQAKRAINSNSAGRGSVGELLIKNWK